MKRTALRRKTPLVAKRTLKRTPFTQTRVKHRRPREVSNSRPAHGARGEPGTRSALPAMKQAGRDPVYLAMVRRLPCCARDLGPCCGPTQAHHAGRRPGAGLKCPDVESHSFCLSHHTEWHAHTGAFKGWRQERRRAWADVQIAATQRRLEPPFDAEQDRRDEGHEAWPVGAVQHE